jgi:uncharacterized membrane protein
MGRRSNRKKITSRRRPRNRRLLVCAAGAGAAFTYLFDPDQGRRRRALLRDKAVRVRHDLTGTVDVVTRDSINRSRGMVARADRLRNDEAPGDGRIYHQVRTRIAAESRHPGAVNVRVVDGSVTLTGPILADEVEAVRSAVHQVEGVQAVDDQLEVHETAGAIPALQGEGNTNHRRSDLLHEHWSPAPRALAGAAGGTLLAIGLNRGGLRGLGMATGGGLLLARAVTNQPLRTITGIDAGPDAVHIEKHIHIDAPTEKVWSHIEDYEHFPAYMSHVREVRREGDGLSHWRVDGPFGTSVEWDAELVEVRPDEALVWRSTHGAPVQHTGYIELEPDGDGSHLQVHLYYNPLAGMAGHAVARIFGVDPKSQLDDDLMRLKTAIETGRAPHDAAQPQPAADGGTA